MNKLYFSSNSDPRFYVQLEYADGADAAGHYDKITAPAGQAEYRVALVVDGVEQRSKDAPVGLVHSLIGQTMERAQVA